MDALEIRDLDEAQLLTFSEKLSQIAFNNKMEIGSCAESIDLRKCGIRHNSCIDKELVETIIGCRINASKDKNQRKECGCVESIEIGTYNTCKNGCKYCYANYSQDSVANNCNKYNPTSPLLCGEIMEGDRINKRKVKSIKQSQISIFDI